MSRILSHFVDRSPGEVLQQLQPLRGCRLRQRVDLPLADKVVGVGSEHPGRGQQFEDLLGCRNLSADVEAVFLLSKEAPGKFSCL